MRKWTKEHDDFLLAYDVQDSVKNLWIAFNLFFPGFTTYSGMKNERYLLGLKAKPAVNHARHRPLLSEQIKKGYVRVKVAEPNIWMQKQRWVYENAFGKQPPKTNFIFLDGNNRNFELSNIEPVPVSLMSTFNTFGGVVKGKPEATRLNIQIAKTSKVMFDVAEKFGLLSGKKVPYRRLKTQSCEIAKKRRQRLLRENPEAVHKHDKEVRTAYKERLKTENPAEYERQKRNDAIRQHEWYLRNKRGK